MFRIRTSARVSVRAARGAAAAGLALAALTALTGIAPASATDTSGTSGPSAQQDGRPGRPASVSGTARISYAFSPNDEIWFTVDAQAVPYTHRFPGTKAAEGLPTDARGSVRYSHRDSSTGKTYSAEAEVDCLSTGGPVATLTAVVTRSDVGNVGERIGLSVYQGGGREGGRLGFSWGVGNLDVGADGKLYQPVVGTCMAPAPFAPVLRGGFTVHHTELEVPKTAGQ
ncbi:hypothetical protein ATKI12_8214 [Kitasatospora sp. Ki12]|uniref:hypothetical protein n=1 Tax=Kitasatospora xanthocidica TaxID=83382 RepID=UPI0019BB014C|nr:hypothetical protein [Kitasatospora xanthocidica]GHF90322.1 hypothetical protein GCM10018790_79370 [Kitasatospora xanthocidica]